MQEWRKSQAWLVVIDKGSECRAADRYPSTFTSLAAEVNSCLSLTRRLLTGSGSCVCHWAIAGDIAFVGSKQLPSAIGE